MEQGGSFMKQKKRYWSWLLLSFGLLLILSGCSQGEVSAQSTGLWDRYIVYSFAVAIKALSFGNEGIGIILFTIIVRILLFPLMHYQMKSMRGMQELQPEIKKLQEQYPGKDPESRRKLNEAQQRLYSEHNVNPLAGCLPLVVQIPIMMALWQAISRVPSLTDGTFLWLELGKKDPYYILPILAALFTYASTKLSSMSQVESNPTMKVMNWIMPLFILIMGINLASGLSLYWVVSNAFQVVQTLIINNPYKIREERALKEQKQKELERALKKAKSGKKKH